MRSSGEFFELSERFADDLFDGVRPCLENRTAGAEDVIMRITLGQGLLALSEGLWRIGQRRLSVENETARETAMMRQMSNDELRATQRGV